MKPPPGRSLLLLQAQGLLKLKPGVGYLPTTLDIIDNPKQLKIVEVDTPQLTRTLDDPNVSLSIINTNFSARAGLSAARDGLFMEGPDSPYVNAIVAREDNKDSKKIQELKPPSRPAKSRKSEGSLQRRRDQRLVSLNRRRPADGAALSPPPRTQQQPDKDRRARGRRHHANRQLCGGKRQPGNDIRPSKALAPASIQAGSNTR